MCHRPSFGTIFNKASRMLCFNDVLIANVIQGTKELIKYELKLFSMVTVVTEEFMAML